MLRVKVAVQRSLQAHLQWAGLREESLHYGCYMYCIHVHQLKSGTHKLCRKMRPSLYTGSLYNYYTARLDSCLSIASKQYSSLRCHQHEAALLCETADLGVHTDCIPTPSFWRPRPEVSGRLLLGKGCGQLGKGCGQPGGQLGWGGQQQLVEGLHC